MIDIYPLVYVEWQDAEHEAEWSDVRDEAKHITVICVSIGWLIHRNSKRIVISASLNPLAGQVGNKQYIPNKMITRYKVLKKGKRSTAEWI